MKIDFYNMMKLLSTNNNSKYLTNTKLGLEKESLRITQSGNLALTPHPSIFGDKITNPIITTDFSESQMEFITPPLSNSEKVHNSLMKIQDHAATGIGNELLWPLSMPAILPNEIEIPIARFNNSKSGRLKEIYREGLSLRYGKKMQMISGIHYNFSFGSEFWDFLFNIINISQNKQDFINEHYFKLARNFLRYRWLLVYLFGASPIADTSFTNNMPCDIEKQCSNFNDINSFKKYATYESVNLNIQLA